MESSARNDKRRMCPNCRAFITSDDIVCPYCDQPVGMRVADQRVVADAMAGFTQGDQFLTNLILLINAGLYLAMLLYSSNGRGISLDPTGSALSKSGDKDGYAIRIGLQWWRLITAGFLHGNICHILMNSYSLWMVGPAIEAVFGTSRYVVIYFVATITGFAASLYFSPYASVGASAAISGLIGALLGLAIRERNSVIGRQKNRIVQVALLTLLPGFIIPLPIDNWAHIGGFLGGFVVAYVTGSRGSGRDEVWKTLAWVSVAVTAYAFFRMTQQLVG